MKAHPRFADAMAFRPKVSAAGEIWGLVAALVIAVVAPVVMIVVWGVPILERWSTGRNASAVDALAPKLWIGFCSALGLGILGNILASLIAAIRYSRAPIKPRIAVVTGKRTKLRGGGKDRSVTTDCYVTLQFRNGSRVEYGCGDELFGQAADDDIGIAYLKDKKLVGLDRFDV